MCPTTIHTQNDSQNKAYWKNVQKTDTCNGRTKTENDEYSNAGKTKQNSGVTASTALYRVIQNDCWGCNNLSYMIHLVLQMQPHVISFYGVTSRIKFMFLLFLQVSRN